MHVTADVDIRTNGLPGCRYLIDHAFQLAWTSRPVVKIIFAWIIALVEVKLHCVEAHLLRLSSGLCKIGWGWQVLLIQRSITIYANLVSEFSSQQLIHGYAKRFACNV